MEYLNEKEDKKSIEVPMNLLNRFKNDKEYRELTLNRIMHLSPNIKNIIKHHLIGILGDLIEFNETFPDVIDFVVKKCDTHKDAPILATVLSTIQTFFDNPRAEGLGNISGQNEIINSPNPNANGQTNNSYYQ